jgi:hypothetical protein
MVAAAANEKRKRLSVREIIPQGARFVKRLPSSPLGSRELSEVQRDDVPTFLWTTASWSSPALPPISHPPRTIRNLTL